MEFQKTNVIGKRCTIISSNRNSNTYLLKSGKINLVYKMISRELFKYKEFKRKQAIEEFPVGSTALHVYYVYDFSEHIIGPIVEEEIVLQFVRLPFLESFVRIPLLHSIK